MTRKELIKDILNTIHCGDPDVEDTDIGLDVRDILAMSDSELEDLHQQLKDFGDHIDNL
jgi:hypothetical protein